MHKVLIAILLIATPALAHEIGTTRVRAGVQGSRYRVEIAADASALAEKLTGEENTPPTLELFRSHEERFRKRLALAFDGQPSHPAISFQITPAVDVNSAILATIELTGPVPPGARQFTWQYGWTFATYSLAYNGAAPVWLEGGDTSKPFDIDGAAPPAGLLTTLWTYFSLGFTHILPFGLDHVLFVLGLYLLNGRARSVLWQASAFTLAHSITLGLTLAGWLNVAPSIVEPLIAISIAYVAIENIVLSELKSWRVALVFAFGLLHGMGFAGILQETGIPPGDFLPALLTFNLGVEAGQLAVIALAFLAVGWRWSRESWYRARVAVPASAAIAFTAVYWTIERLP